MPYLACRWQVSILYISEGDPASWTTLGPVAGPKIGPQKSLSELYQYTCLFDSKCSGESKLMFLCKSGPMGGRNTRKTISGPPRERDIEKSP